MKIRLSMNWELDDGHAAAGYGRPVLVYWPSGQTYGPGDFISLHPFYRLMRAAEAVKNLVRWRKLDEDARALVARFAWQPGQK